MVGTTQDAPGATGRYGGGDQCGDQLDRTMTGLLSGRLLVCLDKSDPDKAGFG